MGFLMVFFRENHRVRNPENSQESKRKTKNVFLKK
jgi:hypothetical protein